ncbi:4-diphosphocytidyl-2-C-methyl-D-erythritol kinase [Neomicrococcus aestuarii]|uniref:4-diphosphocytidyl-2-C-methyl-D-erythritol kinase n=1 Tax=Neomicrococcus aestuarii TaxID=556325 RepID=A0A7W8TR80_9MICC|nr:4-(cytidine 5'-diphospho)-2-C-methyl-D-erythritol kinase [Neomicrococcus aestuarii]MBB5511419.1 4-diphosphocytidyl-2-C-methyl-D-erythritol kinase [Neomicrococcus aestuarii]
MKRPPLIVNRHTALTDHDRDMIGLRSVVARAPGKINVSLEVGPPREDGYHSVATIYLAVNLFEDIRASERMDTEFTISLSPDSAPFADPETFPIGPENLVIRAAAELRAYTGVKAGADLEVTKRVPIAGGMGGGSADAAAALVACNALWETGLNREELAIVGARLGADVPFALYGGAAVGLGVGDQLSPLLLRNATHWVLVPASYGLSTPEVYGTLDKLRAEQDVEAPTNVDVDTVHALVAANVESLALNVRNDMEQAAIHLAPEIATVIATGEKLGAARGIVSGSGPTIAFLAEDKDHAEQLRTLINEELDVDALVVHGPANGAAVVHHHSAFRGN